MRAISTAAAAPGGGGGGHAEGTAPGGVASRARGWRGWRGAVDDPGHEERPKGYLFNQPPPPPGESRRWEDWELPCYVTSFLTAVILGVGLNAKPDLTLEAWAHQKALERLQEKELAAAGDDADAE